MGKRRERVFQFRPHGSEREGIDLDSDTERDMTLRGVWDEGGNDA